MMILFTFESCKQSPDNSDINSDTDSLKSEVPEVKTGNFYSNLSKDNSVVLADTIIYYTVIKNADPEDDWQEKCLSRLDRKALANIIFNAIYNGRLTPYNFATEEPMTIEDVKNIEKQNPRNIIGKVEFTEEWYFNETDFTFTKKVNAIMMGYERPNPGGEAKYVAGVKVYLNGDKMKIDQVNQ